MTADVLLRDVLGSDVPLFFEHQLDPEANWMAGFTAKDPADRAAFDAHLYQILNDASNINKAIIVDGQVVGNIASFEMFGQQQVSYWIDRQYWGKGIATSALKTFLNQVTTRPLYGRAVKDNLGSVRVLEKCGFRMCGEERSFANARSEEVDEVILILDDQPS